MKGEAMPRAANFTSMPVAHWRTAMGLKDTRDQVYALQVGASSDTSLSLQLYS